MNTPPLATSRTAGTLIAPRAAPDSARGLGHWVRTELLSSRLNVMVTVILCAWLLWQLPDLLSWSLLQAIVRPDADACQAARGQGACWGVVTEKYRLILFGRYPFAEQ